MVWLGERVEPVLDDSKRQVVDNVIAQFKGDDSRLVDILLNIQNEMPLQYISKEVASYISWKIDVPLSRTFDVISFYGALSDTPRGKIVIQFCDSVVCRLTGHTEIEHQLSHILGIPTHSASPNGEVWLESVPCFGACDISPAIRINGVVYGHLDSSEKIEEALHKNSSLVDYLNTVKMNSEEVKHHG